MAIRWNRQEKATGLMAIGAAPRQWYLRDSKTGITYMMVAPVDRDRDQWKFYIIKPGSVNLRSKTVFATDKEAKAAADKYWKANREAMVAERKAYEEQREKRS